MNRMCRPLNLILGKACPAIGKCKRRCVLSRESISETLSLKSPQRIIKPKTALIIGGGPAGISCAHTLHENGLDVTLHEGSDRLGGALWLIPESRLPRGDIQELASNLDFNIKLDSNINLERLENLSKQYNYIIIACGAKKSKSLGIEGETLPHVTSSLDFLRSKPKATSVAVIGGGDVAVDSASVARENGADVTLYYRKTESHLRACKLEIEYAKSIGVNFAYEHVPLKFTAEGAIFGNSGGESLVHADLVIVAIGQEAALPQSIYNFPNTYTIGDANLGPSSILAAVTDARKLAYKIISEN